MQMGRILSGRWSTLATIVGLSIMAIGCASTDDTAGTNGSASTSGGTGEGGGGSIALPTLETSSPRVEFVMPMNGMPIPAASDFLVKVNPIYFTLQEPGGPNEKNKGHYAVYLDDREDEYIFVAYGTQGSAKLPDITPGIHTLTAVCLNNDGTRIENSKPDIIEIEVTEPRYLNTEVQPYLELLEPGDMEVVTPGQELTVRVNFQNVQPIPYGEPEPDFEDIIPVDENFPTTGHYRVYVGYAEGEDFLATSVENEVTVTLPETLTPGQHLLRVEVWQANGNLFEGPQPPEGQSVVLVVPGLKKPAVTIESPSAGSLILPGQTLSLDLQVEKFELVPPGGLPGGELDVADGHVRVYLDEATGDDYLVAEASSAPSVPIPEDLEPGAHTLTVVLVDTDGAPVGAAASIAVTSPGFDVLSPEDGGWLEYDTEIAVAVNVSAFELIEPGEDTEPEVGKGHYRVYLDDADGEDYLLASASLEDSFVLPEGVPSGQHELRFSLREKSGAPVGFDRVVDVFVGAGPPGVAILSPFAGQPVHPGTVLLFAVQASNYLLKSFVPDTPNVYGQGHYRVYLDNQTGDNFLLASANTQGLVTLPEDMTLGPHTIRVALHNNDGSELGVETEIWLDVVAPTSPVVQALQPAATTPFAQGSVLNLGVNVNGLDLVPESGINQTGEGHMVIRWKETGAVLYDGEDTEPEIQIPADAGVGLQEIEIQLVSNTGSSFPNARASAWVTVWEQHQVSVSSPMEPPELTWGDTLDLVLAVEGGVLTPVGEEEAVNVENELYVSAALNDAILADVGSATVSVLLPEDLDGGTHTLNLQARNNDGTPIEGAVASVEFVLNAPQVGIVSPDGMTQVYVADSVMDVNLAIEFFDLVPPAPGLLDVFGEGHFLLYLDGATGANFFFEGSADFYTVPLPADLSPGEHTLRAVLVDNTNTAIGVETTQTFTVGPHGLAIVSPAVYSSAPIGLPLVLDLVFENFELIPVGTAEENVAGEGHVEVLLDDESVFVGASGTPEVDIDESLAVGEHIITVRLLNNDGTPLDTPVQVTFPFVVVE